MALSVLVGAPVGAAQAGKPDPEDVADGMRLYRTKADCQTCHGWAADGSAFIVHVNPDTYCPDGAVAGCAGGARAACGVIESLD